MKKYTPPSTSNGFTIVELMIATTVLATLLLLATTIMINIGKLYYKGVSQSHTQNNVRDITDEISQHLELNDGEYNPVVPSPPGTPPVQAVCFGTTRYSYILGWQQGSYDATKERVPHVLWRDTTPSSGCGGTAGNPLPDLKQNNPTASGSELITPGGRLTALTINDNGAGTYTLTIGVAYGDGDLLCNANVTVPTSDCTDDGHFSSHLGDPNAKVVCKGNLAQEFCATASLQTRVSRRL